MEEKWRCEKLRERRSQRNLCVGPDQISLFDEAELDSEVLDTVTDTSSDDEEITVAAHQRKRRGRKPLPEHLPRIDVVHELAEDDRRCDHDGKLLAEIGEVISEQLDIIPAKIQVMRHIRKKYACDCGQCIKTAPLPAQPIPKGASWADADPEAVPGGETGTKTDA